jgi:hypothetical protein
VMLCSSGFISFADVCCMHFDPPYIYIYDTHDRLSAHGCHDIMCDPRELVVYFHVAGAAKTFIFCLMQLRTMLWVHVSVNPRCPAV